MNQLILRATNSPYGDINKGSVLSASELDGNFVSLKGEVIYTAESNTGLVTLKKINGDSFSFAVSATDTVITGGTYNDHTGVATFTNNTGGTFSVTGFSTGSTSSAGVVITGGTYNPTTGIQTLTNNTGGTVTVSGFFKPSDDKYTSGFTFNEANYDLTIHRNDGTNFTQSLHILAGDMNITGGTYNPSNGVATFVNNSGGTFEISGFLTGFTDIDITGGTYSNGTLVLDYHDGHQLSISGFYTGGIIDIDYSTFYSKITTNALEAGRYYNITDFATVWEIPDFYVDGSPKTPTTGYHGGEDSIIVFATSTSQIDVNAWQTKYPKDTIKYDWNFTTTEHNMIAAKGRIIERIDEYGNRTDYDHRNIDFIRYISYYRESLYTGVIDTFDSSSGYILGIGTSFTTELSVGSVIEIDGYCKVKVMSITNDTELYVEVDPNFTVFYFTGGVVPFYSCTSTSRFESYKESYINQFNDNEYKYYKTFAFEQEITDFGYVVSLGNYIGDFSNAYKINGLQYILANNVFGVYAQYNKMGDLYSNNTLGGYCSSNQFGFNCDGNIMGDEFYLNRIKDNFKSNFIGNSFNNNDIGSHFYNNLIPKFKFNYNIISNNFQGNLCLAVAYANTIGEDFNGNKMDGEFIENVIGVECYGNSFTNFNQNKLGDVAANNIFLGAARNVIGDYCGNEKISNQIEESFNDNNVGNYFGNDVMYGGGGSNGGNVIKKQFTNNVIGHSFIYNLIDSAFIGNKIGDYFMLNTTNQIVSDNTIGNYFVGNIIRGVRFISNKLGNYFAYNDINYDFKNNVIGDYCGSSHGNVISYAFMDNKIGDYFGNDGTSAIGGNAIEYQFQNNIIGNYCYGNTIKEKATYNNIGDLFIGNTIDAGFASNRVFDIFGNNQIGLLCFRNTFLAPFSSCIVLNEFQQNTIKNDTTIDFTPATHVYNQYACDILNDNLNVLKLTYLDFSIGGYQMTSPTA